MGGMPGGGKGGNAPSAPNFTQAATPTQTNPFGVTSQWTPSGPGGADEAGFMQQMNSQGVPEPMRAQMLAQFRAQHGLGQMTQTSSFTGPLKQGVGEMEGQIASAWGKPLDTGQQARDAAQQAIYGRETSQLDPQWQQRESQFNSQMAAQGLTPGGEAYDRARGDFDRARTNAYQQASYGSIIGGGQEGQRQQQMDITSRMAPEQALEGLAGLTGQSQNPLLPAAIAQYQGALQNYGIQQQGKNSTMGGLTGLGGNLGSASILGSKLGPKAAPAAGAS